MVIENLRTLLKNVQAGHTGVDEALNDLKLLPYEDNGFGAATMASTIIKSGVNKK